MKHFQTKDINSKFESTDTPLKVAIETHGCKLNQGDTQNLISQFIEAGYEITSKDEPVDIYVVNTCTVTHIADRKARQALRGAKRLNPEALIVATGCYAERAPKALQDIPEVDIVAGNRAKETLVKKILSKLPANSVPCSTGEYSNTNNINNNISRTRAMVKIQEGCNQVCAYCIVPKVRGREISIDPKTIISQIEELINNGYKEIVLTGTQLGTYGFDIPGIDLAGLIELILNTTDLPRLRISSLQPQELSNEILNLWKDPRLCPHFHIPLQSGSNQILMLMRRKYSHELFIEKINQIYSTIPHVSITTDVIVGFPGETDEDFNQTYTLCEKAGFASMHVFPYSSRPGTSASHFSNKIVDTIKTKRSHKLLQLSRLLLNSSREKSLGQKRPVLWEYSRYLDGLNIWYGLTDNYMRVYTESSWDLTNKITFTLLDSSHDGLIYGIVKDPIKLK